MECVPLRRDSRVVNFVEHGFGNSLHLHQINVWDLPRSPALPLCLLNYRTRMLCQIQQVQCTSTSMSNREVHLWYHDREPNISDA